MKCKIILTFIFIINIVSAQKICNLNFEIGINHSGFISKEPHMEVVNSFKVN